MIPRRRFLTLAAAAPFAALATGPVFAATPLTFAEDGVAINGYDPVAYFMQSEPVEGMAEFGFDWNGATWRFASAANRAAFATDPAAYAPRYGGYCAYAVSQGYTATTDPDAWTVHDGKLYLNYSRRVRRIWLRDIPGHVAAADANWPGVLG